MLYPTTLTCLPFKVFVKADDGHWRICASHFSRREAELAADFLLVRRGVVARVMM
jgi:hypothetical protein